MTRIPNTRTTQKKNNAGGRTQHNKSQRKVKTLKDLLDNENKNLYPMNKMDYINIDIALCKDKGVMNYKIFNIEKKQFTDGQDHTDSKFIDATAENLNAEISKIKSSGKLQHVNDTTQYIHIMLVLRDNDNNKPGSLKIYKVTNLPHNNKDKCVIGAIIHTEDVDTQNINSDNAIIVEPVVNSGEVPTIDRNRRKHRGQRRNKTVTDTTNENVVQNENIVQIQQCETTQECIKQIIEELGTNGLLKIDSIKTLLDNLLTIIDLTKNNLEDMQRYANNLAELPTYTRENITTVLTNYNARLTDLEEHKFQDTVMDGIFIFKNLKYYFDDDLEAIVHDLGIGLKGKNNKRYNYITNKHEGGRVTHKNKRKLKKQKRRYTKRANRK